MSRERTICMQMEGAGKREGKIREEKRALSVIFSDV